jgi:hypothetical protein
MVIRIVVSARMLASILPGTFPGWHLSAGNSCESLFVTIPPFPAMRLQQNPDVKKALPIGSFVRSKQKLSKLTGPAFPFHSAIDSATILQNSSL